jgi:soluble lytic murein transglycosylase-like protein
MITIACDFYDVPQYYFSKMLEVESNFNPKAVAGPNQNGSYDYGIAQLNSEYLEEFGWRYNFGKIDPFDPEQSIWKFAVELLWFY